MKKQILIFIVSVIMTLQCSAPKNKLIGTWKGQAVNYFNYISFTLNFSDSGFSFDSGADGKVDIKGKWEISESLLTLTDMEGENACPPSQSGTYTYMVSGDTLKLTINKDDCESRAMILPEIRWIKE